MGLYDDLMKSKPLFSSNEEALAHYTKEYEALGQKYGQTGDQLYMNAVEQDFGKDDHQIIVKDMDRLRSLSMRISMVRYLIDKANRDGK